MTPHKIAIAIVAALVLAPSAMAQQQVPTTVDLDGGVTKLSLNSRTKAKLARQGIRVIGRSFAIASGTIDPVDGNPADVVHDGRLTFRGRNGRLGFGQLNVELGTTSRLFGTAGGQVTALANLSGGGVARQGIYSTDVNSILARLTKPAARALNRRLNTRAFRSGMRLGELSMNTQLDAALIAAEGQTTLQIAQQAAEKLASQGITATPVAPATAGFPCGCPLPAFFFPIAGGTVKVDQTESSVLHDGGLLLSKGQTQIPLSQPGVELGPTNQLTVSIGGATRVAAADIDVAGAVLSGTANGLSFSNLVVKLNATAAGLLNQAFSTTVFQAGDVVGTASSSVTFK